MRTTLAAIAVGFTLLMGANRTNAASVTLYDGSGLPNNQNPKWLEFETTPSPFPKATQTVISGGTRLDTGFSNGSSPDPNNISGGYSNYNNCTSACTPTLVNSSFPTLDSNAGYTLRLDFKINSESHADNNRAGFSIIAISSDKKGIELGFWSNEIWAQNDNTSGTLFTHGEGAVFNTTTATTRYDLQVQGSNYKLFTGGSSTPLLTGSVRDYSAFDYTKAGPSGLPLPYNPYTTPNFVFLGDDTSRAQVSADITFAQVSTTPVPFEFSPTLGLLTLAAWSAIGQMRKKE